MLIYIYIDGSVICIYAYMCSVYAVYICMHVLRVCVQVCVCVWCMHMRIQVHMAMFTHAPSMAEQWMSFFINFLSCCLVI